MDDFNFWVLCLDLYAKSILKIKVLDKLDDFTVLNIKNLIVVEKESCIKKIEKKVKRINFFARLIHLLMFLIIIFPTLLYCEFYYVFNMITLLIAMVLYVFFMYLVLFIDAILIDALEKEYGIQQKRTSDNDVILLQLRKMYYYHPFKNIGPDEIDDCLKYEEYNMSIEELNCMKLDDEFKIKIIENCKQLNEDLKKSRLIKKELQFINQLKFINDQIREIADTPNNLITDYSTEECMSHLSIKEREERINKLEKDIQKSKKIIGYYKIYGEKVRQESEELKGSYTNNKMEKPEEQNNQNQKKRTLNTDEDVSKESNELIRLYSESLFTNNEFKKMAKNFVTKELIIEEDIVLSTLQLLNNVNSESCLRIPSIDKISFYKINENGKNFRKIEASIDSFNNFAKMVIDQFSNEIIQYSKRIKNLEYYLEKRKPNSSFNVSIDIVKYAIVLALLEIELAILEKKFNEKFNNIIKECNCDFEKVMDKIIKSSYYGVESINYDLLFAYYIRKISESKDIINQCYYFMNKYEDKMTAYKIERKNNLISVMRKIQSKNENIVYNYDLLYEMVRNFINKKIFNRHYSFLLIMTLCLKMMEDTYYNILELYELPKLNVEIKKINTKEYTKDFDLLLKLLDHEYKAKIVDSYHHDDVLYSKFDEGSIEKLKDTIYKMFIMNIFMKLSTELLYKEFIARFKDLIEREENENLLIKEIIKYPSIYRNENIDLLFGYIEKHHNRDLFISYEKYLKVIDTAREEYSEKRKLDRLKNELLQGNIKIEYYTLSDIDKMTGMQFEAFLRKLFTKMGYTCQMTKGSQDQGLDLIIEKENQKIGVQAKCYTSSHIGNKAIQEVIAGSQYYHCAYSLVVTNSYFTKQAEDLAQRTSVVLWDRNKLTSLLIEYSISK